MYFIKLMHEVGGIFSLRRQTDTDWAIGNESLPKKIVINDTIIFFLKLQSAFW